MTGMVQSCYRRRLSAVCLSVCLPPLSLLLYASLCVKIYMLFGDVCCVQLFSVSPFFRPLFMLLCKTLRNVCILNWWLLLVIDQFCVISSSVLL